VNTDVKRMKGRNAWRKLWNIWPSRR